HAAAARTGHCSPWRGAQAARCAVDDERPGARVQGPRAGAGPASWLAGGTRLMDLAWRIAQVIIPVFMIVAVGYWYGRSALPDLTMFNRIVLDVMTPVLVYTAHAGKEFRLADYTLLLAAGAALILLSGAIAWLLARSTRTSPRSLVPVVMFTNYGNM